MFSVSYRLARLVHTTTTSDCIIPRHLELGLESQSRVNAIFKLALVGEQAGFSLEQMIELLNSGVKVVALLELITMRIDAANSFSCQRVSQSC